MIPLVEDIEKNLLIGLGIEIGREMGFYEWAVSYENRYKSSSKDYEWRVGVHFTLLTSLIIHYLELELKIQVEMLLQDQMGIYLIDLVN